MPFYEYQCKSCGHDLEAMQKVNDPPLRKCPHCGKSQLQRLMSAPVFRLKGGGWYETDFKGEGDTKKNLADKPEADAPKDGDAAGAAAKEGGKEAGKEGAAAGADAGKGKDGGKAGDGKAGGKEAAPTKDKADRPAAVKAPSDSAKRASDSGKSAASRGRTTARGRAPVKRPAKKAAPKAKRR